MEKKTVTFVAKMDEFLQSVVSQCHELGIFEDLHIEAIRVDQLPFRPITPGRWWCSRRKASWPR